MVASSPVSGVGLVTLFVFILVMMSPTYSSAQTIVSVSKEFQTPDIELNESTVKDTESEEQPKTTTTIPRKEVEGGLDLDTPGIELPYKVKVKFDSITINRDREGPASGDGEFDLSAYVEGKRVDLTAASGIWDAKEGKTYQFNPGTEVTVDLPNSIPLSIFFFGLEIDGCGRINWPGDSDPVVKDLVAKLYAEIPLQSRKKVINEFMVDIFDDNGSCGIFKGDFLDNDDLGGTIKNYDAPDYGKGSHEEKSEFAYSGFWGSTDGGAGTFTLRYTISVTAPPPPPPPTIKPETSSGTCNNNLPVSGVTSSGSISNSFPPNNSIDNNLSTKWWSTIMVNPFITLDLGSSKSVCGIDIAWADGAVHPYRFDISASTDGTSFTKVFSGTSSGTTSSPEKYSIPLTQARYVKITITESTPGATRSIAEISEIDIFG